MTRQALARGYAVLALSNKQYKTMQCWSSGGYFRKNDQTQVGPGRTLPHRMQAAAAGAAGGRPRGPPPTARCSPTHPPTHPCTPTHPQAMSVIADFLLANAASSGLDRKPLYFFGVRMD